MTNDAAAIELARALLADPAGIARVIARVDDPAIERRERVTGALALALAASQGAELPAEAFALLDDDLLIDTLLSAGASAAITGMVAAAGDRASPALRRHLALRLVSTNAAGAHVAAFLLSHGELAAGMRAAAGAINDGARGRTADDPRVLALVELATRWTAAHGEPFADLVAARLPLSARALLAAAIRLRDMRPDQPLLRALERDD